MQYVKLKPLLAVLIICICGLRSFAPPCALAAQSLNESSVLNVLAALEVMNGDASGSLNLGSPVTRAEFTKMTLAASPAKNAAAAGSAYSPYSDVTKDHWAAGYVKAARDAGLISGYLDGTFRPDNHVQLAEAATIVLKNLGYGEEDFRGSYPSGQMSLYHSLRLDDNLTLSDPYGELTRRDCAYLIYNMLNARAKDGRVLAEDLGYSLDGSGHIDYLTLLNDKISGPYIVSGADWQSGLGFTPAVVYRNDSASSAAAVQPHDVIYYSSGMRTVWAYNKQKTGAYEAALPDRTNPESVTLSGVSYRVGSSEAAYALSVLGGHSLGESLTVLLGRDDSIVGVLGAGSANAGASASAASQAAVCGIVTAVGSKSYTDSSGNSYTAQYVQITGTDGASYEFQATGGSAVGALVQARSQNGRVSINRLSTSESLSGTFNAAANRLGSKTLAPDLQILDVSISRGASTQVKAAALHKSRLDGVRLESGSVLYWEQDADGAICRLILDNLSGDLAEYGIMQKASEEGSYGSYEFVLNGRKQTLQSPGTAFNIKTGPFAMLRVDSEIVSMRSLSSFNAIAISGANSLTDSAGAPWLLSDSAQVYEYRGGEYYQTSLNLLNTRDFELRAYYDKAASGGGRVRIVIATAK